MTGTQLQDVVGAKLNPDYWYHVTGYRIRPNLVRSASVPGDAGTPKKEFQVTRFHPNDNLMLKITINKNHFQPRLTPATTLATTVVTTVATTVATVTASTPSRKSSDNTLPAVSPVLAGREMSEVEEAVKNIPQAEETV